MSLRGFFRRFSKRTPPIDLSPNGSRATDEWRAGDLGECVGDGPWLFMGNGGLPVAGPHKGDLVRVTAVSIVCGHDALAIDGLQHWWQASCFRKLYPEQASGSRKAWTDLLKTVRPREKVHG